MPALLVHCSCPDAATAQAIAQALVEERLAACVQIVPGMRSIYRWQDRIEHDDEVLLLIKTTAAHWSALVARVSQLHPYEVPELLAFTASAGSPAYIDWLDRQIRAQ